MIIYWKRLFCGTHCFMISICDAESQFNDGTNEKYHLLIHHKELELVHEKLLPLKSPRNTKIASNTAITKKKEKKISLKYTRIKLSMLPMNHQYDVPL